AILKKIKAKAVLDLNGMAFSKTNIPKIIALPQEFFLDKKQIKGVNKLANEQGDRSIIHSAKTLSYSNNKTALLKKEKIENKIEVIPFTAPAAFKTFEWHENIMS